MDKVSLVSAIILIPLFSIGLFDAMEATTIFTNYRQVWGLVTGVSVFAFIISIAVQIRIEQINDEAKTK